MGKTAVLVVSAMILAGCAGMGQQQELSTINIHWFLAAGYDPGFRDKVTMAASETENGHTFSFGCIGQMPVVAVQLLGVDSSEAAGPNREVEITIDDQLYRQRWINDHTHESAMLAHGQNAMTLIHGLSSAEKVTVSTDDGAHTETWHIGFAPAMRALQPDCGKMFARP